MSRWTVLKELYAGLDARMRPEDVAKLILDGFGNEMPRSERQLLEGAVRSSRGRYWYGSMMAADFERPATAQGKVDVLLRLLDDSGTQVDGASPEQVRELIESVAHTIDWHPGDAFKHRMTRQELKESGLHLSKRQYNRLLRHLARMHDKVERLERQVALRELLIAGRNGLVADIGFEQFTGDPKAACFVAYFTARRNLRREFSLSGKVNPFDEIAEMLLRRCVVDEDTNWWMISRVHSKPEIVARLSRAEQGQLMGRWSALMRSAAELLAGAWSDQVNRRTMVVRPGMDSSTWNTVAAAYNTARAGWMNVVYAVGAERLLDVACPGKVMRVMAADLVYWHTSSGSKVDPDTEVWASLPLPWKVLRGEELCSRETVAAACRRAGLDPELSGWTAPRARGKVAKFEPTPELVHGVTVADPAWGDMLRRAGAFSGKQIKAGYAGVLAVGFPVGMVTSDLPGMSSTG
ncbi:hypothetical protein [Micromonospora sp. NPDC047730]|uniref:hypothetical protein n=1 Tax=Micromonospora sp. NPDC047730 TaxID=3364253 RepID=UPI0037216609